MQRKIQGQIEPRVPLNPVSNNNRSMDGCRVACNVSPLEWKYLSEDVIGGTVKAGLHV